MELRNLLLALRFKGTRYHGFQVQQNALSVCQVFQDAVERVLGKRWDVKGCSRTDTGVHANRYGISMKIDHGIPCDKLVLALNSNLPDDISVISAREMPLDFHARYSCLGKEYVYKILNSRIRDPFSTDLYYQYPVPLDVDLLNRQARDFVGTNDFAAFCTRAFQQENTVRTIHSFSVKREGDIVLFVVAGDGFLYNMVRIMVGTLLYIAMGRIPPERIPQISASKDRGKAGKTMPAKGLYLNRVDYEFGSL